MRLKEGHVKRSGSDFQFNLLFHGYPRELKQKFRFRPHQHEYLLPVRHYASASPGTGPFHPHKCSGTWVTSSPSTEHEETEIEITELLSGRPEKWIQVF